MIDIGRQIVTFRPAAYEVPISVVRASEPKISPSLLPVKTVKRKRPKVRKTRVLAAMISVLELKKGQNIAIHHKPLAQGRAYVFTPEPIVNLVEEKLATAPKALLGDDPQAIPLANFGNQPVKITENRLLGYLESLEEENLGPQLVEDLYMVEVFLGETHLGDNQPYVLHKDQDEEFDATSADISAYWGEEYQKQMRQLVNKHAHLFRPTLGSFNNGI